MRLHVYVVLTGILQNQIIKAAEGVLNFTQRISNCEKSRNAQNIDLLTANFLFDCVFVQVCCFTWVVIINPFLHHTACTPLFVFGRPQLSQIISICRPCLMVKSKSALNSASEYTCFGLFLFLSCLMSMPNCERASLGRAAHIHPLVLVLEGPVF